MGAISHGMAVGSQLVVQSTQCTNFTVNGWDQ